METVSVSEIQRNLHKLDDFDIVEVVDMKRHQVKGYFLDKKYREFVEKIMEEKKARREKKLKALAALGSYDLGGEDIREIKASMYD